jgi:hypothetical protein
MLNRDDVELARATRTLRAPGAGFPHASHLRVAWVYLHECRSIDQAIDRMADTLRRFAVSVGQAEKYSDPTTAFWMLQVAAARAAMPSASFEAVVQAYPRLWTRISFARTRLLMSLRLVPAIHRATHRIGLFLADLRDDSLSQGESHILASLATSGPATIAEAAPRPRPQALHADEHPRSPVGSRLRHARRGRRRSAHVRGHADRQRSADREARASPSLGSRRRRRPAA